MIGRQETGPSAGLVLAGGRSRRMAGRDKAWLDVGGETLLVRVYRRLASQAEPVAIAAGANANLPETGAPLLDDGVFAGAGPLAGILAGLRWADEHRASDLVTAPVDVPFLPDDLAERLGEAGKLAFAASAGRTHWTVGRWPVSLQPRLAAFLTDPANRSVAAVAGTIDHAVVTFPHRPGDPFFNVNTPADLATARRRATEERA